jgi:hypothetical protein
MPKPLHILVDIGHPGDVHVFHDPIKRWQANGHRVTITTSDKDVSLQLLDSYGLPYRVVGARRPGLLNLANLLVMRTVRITRLSWRDRPDILVSICSATGALSSFLLRRPHVAFDDSEFGTQQRAVYKPFTAAIITPQQFELDFGRKHVRYNGFKELAYLHPSVFRPDPQRVRDLGYDPDLPYFILRSVAWDAAHDYGEHGLTQAGHQRLAERLSQVGRVIVSYEGQAPKDWATGQVLPIDAMLHLLAFAQLLVSEGLTMVTEAALLGTPAILVNTLQAGNMKRLKAIGLADLYADDRGALACVERWLANPHLKAEAQAKRQALLEEVVNVSEWMSQYVEEFALQGRP